MIQNSVSRFYTIVMWTRGPIDRVKEGFVVSITLFALPASSTIFGLVKRRFELGFFLDKKHAKQNAVQTPVKVTEARDFERRTCLCDRFLADTGLYNGVLDPKLESFTTEASFQLSGYITPPNNRHWSSINHDRILKCPLIKRWRVVCNYCYTNRETHIF
jgi:hypothetical protein